MDLIYTDEERNDLGVYLNYSFDLAYGEDENNFELTTDTSHDLCVAGSLIYIEGTEYGGIVDRKRVVTSSDSLVYSGRTWHGILSSKVIQPPVSEPYYVISGEANQCISELIEYLELSELFTATETDSGITISNYKIDRYIDGYNGIKKMLSKVGGKLLFEYNGSKVELSAVPIVDYSDNEQFDSDQMELDIEQVYNNPNHLICLGSGELTERTVIHLYADEDGNISTTQTYTGLDERVEVYDYPSVESEEELERQGTEYFESLIEGGTISGDLDSDSTSYDIGDVMGAIDNLTGVKVTATINKKIVTIKNGIVTIKYETGVKA